MRFLSRTRHIVKQVSWDTLAIMRDATARAPSPARLRFTKTAPASRVVTETSNNSALLGAASIYGSPGYILNQGTIALCPHVESAI